MIRLRELLRIFPKGKWEINEEREVAELVGPLNKTGQPTIIQVISNDLVTEELVLEFLLELLNSISDIINDLDSERLKTVGLFKELNHVKELKKQSYAKGVSDAYSRLTDVEVRTPTARDALLEASGRVLELLDEDK